MRSAFSKGVISGSAVTMIMWYPFFDSSKNTETAVQKPSLPVAPEKKEPEAQAPSEKTKSEPSKDEKPAKGAPKQNSLNQECFRAHNAGCLLG